MARLINADALQKKYGTKIGEWRGDGLLPSMECLMWIAAQDMLESAPIIDAIPVEWIREFCENDVSDDQRETIGWMLGVWHKEQEAR